LKIIHRAGYLYLDIKLNNILVGEADELDVVSSLNKVRLIDFGLSRKYLDPVGQHIPNKVERVFKGNIVFSSKHLFNLESPSRRDDLISLGYLMIYMISGDIPFIKEDEEEALGNLQAEQEREFRRVKALKNSLTPAQLCNT
jgi:casein kinase 1 alpha